jgi:hypothetical protein
MGSMARAPAPVRRWTELASFNDDRFVGCWAGGGDALTSRTGIEFPPPGGSARSRRSVDQANPRNRFREVNSPRWER